MRLPASFSDLEAELSTHFAGILTPGQQRTLVAWVVGTVVAGSACQTMVALALEETLSPATIWNPLIPGEKAAEQRDRFLRSTASVSLPAKDEDIAFAPVTHLSRWLENRQLSSERLTRIYLDRLDKFNPQLRCAITITRDLALKQAKQADQEIAQGKYRGPLHGIPWGGKDLLDTAGIPTTYGAEPYRNRVPKEDAEVVRRLHAAGESESPPSHQAGPCKSPGED